VREFAAKGYAGATTAGVARRAGVTQPLVHHHFASKRGLWKAALDLVSGEYRQAMAAAETRTSGAPLIEIMKARLTAFVLFSAARPEAARLVMTEAASGDETFDYVYDRYLKPELQALQALLRRAEAEGLFRKSDHALMPFLIIGAAIQPFSSPRTLRRLTGLSANHQETAGRHAAQVIDALLHGLLR
jgi:AcrR family transcriptional regulator